MTNPTPHGQVPEALRLALSIDLMDTFTDYQQEELNKAAAELRRLHAENERLSGLCDKWNSECDEFREDNKRLAALVEEQHTRIAELEAVGASGVQALSVLEDAARWQELREQHESDEALCCVFAPNDMRECLVPVGSLPGELDAFMDSERAARKQGANHD